MTLKPESVCSLEAGFLIAKHLKGDLHIADIVLCRSHGDAELLVLRLELNPDISALVMQGTDAS